MWMPETVSKRKKRFFISQNIFGEMKFLFMLLEIHQFKKKNLKS